MVGENAKNKGTLSKSVQPQVCSGVARGSVSLATVRVPDDASRPSIYVNTYTFMYIYLDIYISCIYIYISLCTYIYIYIYTYTYKYAYLSTHICIYAYT